MIWMIWTMNRQKGSVMKKICGILIMCLCFAGIIRPVQADIDKNKAVEMIENLTGKGIEEIVNSNASSQEKNEIFRKLFSENLDLDFIGRYVLGRYWRTASATQKKEFINLYREFNVITWSKRFDEFKGKKFVFDGTSSASNPDQIFVNTKVTMGEGAPVSVKWRVYDRNNKLKIIDIIIENVSLAQTARNEYTAFIAKSPNGLDGLLENLREKIRQ